MYLAPLPTTLEVTLELAKQADVDYVVALSGGAHWQAHADAVAASGLVQHPTRARRVPGELRAVGRADQGDGNGAGALSECSRGTDLHG